MKKPFVYFLSLGHFVTDLSPGALPAILPFFALHYGLTYTEVAGLVFASSCLSSVVQPVFGYLADRSTQHWFMGFGVLLTGLALAVTGWVSNYWIIFTAITLMGVGSSIFHPQAARFVNYVGGRKKSTAMGIFSVGGNAGFGFAPLIAIWAITAWGLPGITLFGVLSLGLGGVLLIMLPALERASARSREEARVSDPANEIAKNDWKSFLKLTLVIIGRSVVYCTLSAFLPLYCIRSFGVSEALAGTTLSVFAFGCTAMTLVGGWLGDRIGLIRTLRLGSLVLIPSVAAISACTNIGWIYVVLVILSFGINATYASFVVLGQTYLARNIGFASGITLGVSFSIGGMVVPLLGKVADWYSLDVVMALLVVLSSLCALGSFFLKERASLPRGSV